MDKGFTTKSGLCTQVELGYFMYAILFENSMLVMYDGWFWLDYVIVCLVGKGWIHAKVFTITFYSTRLIGWYNKNRKDKNKIKIFKLK